MTSPPTPTPTVKEGDAELDPRRWLALVVCCSALFMTLLDISVTNVALPSIAADTGAGPSQIGWIVSGYTLAFGLVPVIAGRLGDDHGRRLMFLIGVGSFAVTSAVAGLAPGPGWLIAARVLQGVSGGLINPQVSGLIQQSFPGSERGRAFGFLGATVGLGTALGPLLGGLMIGLGGPSLGWRLVFFLNVPIGLVVIVLARRLLPRDVAGGRHSLDVGGALLLGAGLFCVLFACVEYDALRDPRLAFLLIPALGFLTVFYRRERALTDAEADPLVDLRLFRDPGYTSGIALALAFFPAIAGIPLVLAIFYQDGLGLTAWESGLGVTAYAVGSGISATVAGRWVNRLGRRLVVAAVLLMACGAGLVVLVSQAVAAEHLIWWMAGPLLVMGFGSGAVITPNQALALMDVDPVMGSTAGGVLQTAQRVGLALGQAVLGAVFFAVAAGGTEGDYLAALGAAVGVAAGFLTVAFAIGVVDLRRARRRRFG